MKENSLKESMTLLKSIMIYLFLSMFIVGVINSCATFKNATPMQQSYKILKSSQVTYDLITNSVIDLHKQKLISDVTYKQIEDIANKYSVAHNTAIDVVKAFNLGIGTKEDVSSKITAVSAVLTELMKIATPYLIEGGK